MANATHRDATILADHYSFTPWYLALEARCTSLNVWDLIDPDHTATPTAKPEPPLLPKISEYEPSLEPRSSGRSMRSTPTLGGARSQTMPTHKQDLSPLGLQAYNDDVEAYKLSLEDFKIRERAYDKEQKSLDTVMLIIQSTVSSHLKQTCCLPRKTLREWVTNLKQRMGISSDEERAAARERYHNALRPMRAANSWDTWLLEYDHAATTAEVEGVSETTDHKAMIRDFLKAVRKVVPNWADNFKENQLNLPDMNRKEMMKRFRERMSEDHPKSKTYKAAFVVGEDHFNSALAASGASTVATERDASKCAESAPSAPGPRTQGGRQKSRQQKQAQGQRAKSKRPREGSTEVDGASCPACEQRHHLTDCYYVFKEKAPEWWSPRPATERLVKVLLEHDDNFQEQVRACKRSRTRTPAMKVSQTPEVSYE